MMQITLQVSPGLAGLLGATKMTVAVPAGSSLAEFLAQVREQYPALAQKLAGGADPYHVPYNYFVNRKAVTPLHVAGHILHDGDRVHILLPVVGG